jgi:hypothetical protein
MADGDRANRRPLFRNAEPRAEIGHDLWRNAEEQGAKPFVYDGEQDECSQSTKVASSQK